MRVELYRDPAGEWRWRLYAGNGEIIADGESYTRKWSARRAVRKMFPGVPVSIVP